MLTADRVRYLLHYNPETGHFVWLLDRSGTKRAGRRAGCLRPDGYRFIATDGGGYYEHRLAWLYVTGEWPAARLDHINGQRDDNRFENLRVASLSENMRNRKTNYTSTTGLKGVQPRKSGRWAARIMVDGGRRIHIGTFDTAEEAHAAYCVAAERHHGEFARVE
jgi:hypothetical protein